MQHLYFFILYFDSADICRGLILFHLLSQVKLGLRLSEFHLNWVSGCLVAGRGKLRRWQKTQWNNSCHCVIQYSTKCTSVVTSPQDSDPETHIRRIISSTNWTSYV